MTKNKNFAHLLITVGALCLAAWASIGVTMSLCLVTNIISIGPLCGINTSYYTLLPFILTLFVAGLTSIYWGRAIIDHVDSEQFIAARMSKNSH